MEQICANNMDKKGVTSGVIIFPRVLRIMRIILRDFPIIQTYKKLCHNQCSPRDRVCGQRGNRNCLIIDIAYPSDWRVDTKNEEKINKYLDLAIDIKELWKMKSVKVVLVVIGALVAIPKRLEGYLKNINAGIELTALQRTVLLGSARILRRVLEVWGSLLRPDTWLDWNFQRWQICCENAP